jgi:hypothetical protein
MSHPTTRRNRHSYMARPTRGTKQPILIGVAGNQLQVAGVPLRKANRRFDTSHINVLAVKKGDREKRLSQQPGRRDIADLRCGPRGDSFDVGKSPKDRPVATVRSEQEPVSIDRDDPC